MPKKSIVIVEDEIPIAEAEKMILESDYDVTMVHHGSEAVRVIKDKRPDLVLLDVMLPGLNGFDICRILKADSEITSKIVMVTAKNEEKDEMIGMGLGADDYLMKPFESVELIHIVNQTLNKRN